MRQEFFKNARRVVVKIGTSVLESSGELDERMVDRLARDLAHVRSKHGQEIVLVSSGAIASGMRIMGLRKRPAQLEKLQALAAIGQRSLMQVYDAAFRKVDMTTAQILLTWDDLGIRKRYENTQKTVAQILSYGAIPIINENDTVATEEIQFGDNDRLSAMVAMLIDADLLVILSDSDGLYADYAAGKNSRIPVVYDLNASVFEAVRDSKKAFSKGGMASKLQAVDRAVSADIPCALADGKSEHVLTRLMGGEDVGTLFLPKMKKRSSKKRWISYVSKPSGTVVIDGGAEDAILKKAKSLLAKGIVRIKGHFGAGETVAIVNLEGSRLGNGIINFSSAELDKIRGANSKEWSSILGRPCMGEVVHQDNFGAA